MKMVLMLLVVIAASVFGYLNQNTALIPLSLSIIVAWSYLAVEAAESAPTIGEVLNALPDAREAYKQHEKMLSEETF